MRVRPAIAADLVRLQHVHGERLAFLAQGDRRIRLESVQWLDRDCGRVWVGEVDGEIAGFISVWWMGGTWIIDHMALDAHTYHPGLARALVTAATDTARSNGATQTLVNIPSYDPVEQAFWLALGATSVTRAAHPGYQWMQFNL